MRSRIVFDRFDSILPPTTLSIATKQGALYQTLVQLDPENNLPPANTADFEAE